jgi:hypothetical protein
MRLAEDLMRGLRSLTKLCLATAALSLVSGSPAAAEAKPASRKPSSAGTRTALSKPDLSIDEARMIVKDIPSVDIKATLGRWKLLEPDLVQLRQWSSQLVENPARTDLIPKWAELIRQVASRNLQLKESDITPLIRMIMLASYEEAQKYLEPAPTGQANVYKELQEQIRTNLTQARQLQALAGSERRDPLAGSRLSLPGYQRTLRRCEVLSGSPQKLECKEVLVSTSHELEDFITTSETQLKRAEEEAKRGGTVSEDRQEKRREILYALSDVAKAMHDSAVAVLRKISG